MPDLAIQRVLMTTDTVGGVWTFAVEMAKELTRAGIEVLLVSLGGLPSPQQTAEVAQLPHLMMFPSDYKLEWMDDPWEEVEKSGQWLLQIEQEYRPDLIHLNSFGHGHLRWSAPVVLTAHSCVLSWWQAVKGKPAPSQWDPYRDAVTRSLSGAAIVISPTRAMDGSLKSNYTPGRVPTQKIIYNGRDVDLFVRASKEPFVLTAGRLWDEAKNTAAVAEIASKLSWPVYAAGAIAQAECGAARFNGIQLLGSLSTVELASWLSRASIFALPAFYEPFGLSILEAGLCGCALVLGDIPSLREIWGSAALFVPPHDKKALSAAIQWLISDRRLLEEMADRSYKRARHFDSRSTAQAYLRAYQSVVSVQREPCIL